jgi:hypothetical protein
VNNSLINLQHICSITEVKTKNLFHFERETSDVDTINYLLSKGWVLLKIYKITQTERYDTENEIIYESLVYVLGFPKPGIDPTADNYRDEFDL